MKKTNQYEEALDTAAKATQDAWDAAVKAVRETEHFTVLGADGIPDWKECFFGKTKEAYENALEEYRRVCTLFIDREAELKREKKEWEAAHPEETAEKKRQASIKRYERLAREKKAAIDKLQKELTEIERKLEELEG